MWSINQNTAEAPLYENKSIDGVATYSGDVANPSATFKANVMKKNDHLGIDHGLSDTWSYVLGDSVELSKSALLYENPNEKIITGFVFFDTTKNSDGVGTYDKLTDDHELPYAKIEAYYGDSSEPFYTGYSDSIGNYSIPVDMEKYKDVAEKGIRIVVSYRDLEMGADGKPKVDEDGNYIEKQYSAYHCTTTGKNNQSEKTYYISEQYVQFKEGNKEERASDVGFNAKLSEKPIRIIKKWTPENLASDTLKATFNIIGKNATDPADNTIYYKEENVEVEAILGNQADFPDLPNAVYVNKTETKEVALKYDVEENVATGFSQTGKENKEITEGDGTNKTTYNTFTFTNTIQEGKLSERVWADKNGNGVQDADEGYIKDATIYVKKYVPGKGFEFFTDTSGIDTTNGFVTDINGRNEQLEQLNLQANTYKIEIEPPKEGYIRCTSATEAGKGTGQYQTQTFEPAEQSIILISE